MKENNEVMEFTFLIITSHLFLKKLLNINNTTYSILYSMLTVHYLQCFTIRYLQTRILYLLLTYIIHTTLNYGIPIKPYLQYI